MKHYRNVLCSDEMIGAELNRQTQIEVQSGVVELCGVVALSASLERSFFLTSRAQVVFVYFVSFLVAYGSRLPKFPGWLKLLHPQNHPSVTCLLRMKFLLVNLYVFIGMFTHIS